MYDAFAKGATRIGEVDKQAIEELLEKHSEFCEALLEWQSMRLKSMIRLLEEHATLPLPIRMARQMHRLAKDHGIPHEQGELKIALPLHQSDLAALAGCSRQRANEQMVDLARRNVIRYVSGTYVIANPGALQALCDSQPSLPP
jgi:CRP-like cAMP-binding protein